MIYREWDVLPKDTQAEQALCDGLGIGHLLAGVLAARGLTTPQAANDLLHSTTALPSPFAISDMDKAVERIQTALAKGELIVVFGDYDVDGITATALLYTYLDMHSDTVFYKLPKRGDDGYGLTPALVDMMAKKGISLIITVDGGSSSHEGTARAKEHGIDVVITDHHLPPAEVPEVAAFVNPCRRDDTSGLQNLSGVGVAFMLVAALEGCTPEEMLADFGDLVAVGTVADVMKLTGYNRTLVSKGLEVLCKTERVGLAALIEVCGWAGRDITSENISYGIAPRLNAAGRMDDATDALQLLLAESADEAGPIAQSLQEQNLARQKMEQEIQDIIVAQVDADTGLQNARVLVVAGEGWHAGIIGIVASRLVERYAKPVIVISVENGEGRGSGRSIGGFSLYNAIAACEGLLVRFGGHDLAAGLSIDEGKIEEFRKEINLWVAKNWALAALPKRLVDSVVLLRDLELENVRQLEQLAPCGSGNPSPKFMLQNMRLDGMFPLSAGKHCRLRFCVGKELFSAVLFGTSPESLPYVCGDELDIVIALSLYEGKNGEQVSARIIEMRPAALGNKHAAQCALFESFSAGGEISAEDKMMLYPSREEVGQVYRALMDGARVSPADLRSLFARLSKMEAGKVLAALNALEELSLVKVNSASGLYGIVPTEKKQDLRQSVILQRLEG